MPLTTIPSPGELIHENIDFLKPGVIKPRFKTTTPRLLISNFKVSIANRENMPQKSDALVNSSGPVSSSIELPVRDRKEMLEMQDCVSCKYLGSTACLGMAAYTIYWSVRKQAEYRGPTRLIYMATCFSLAGGELN